MSAFGWRGGKITRKMPITADDRNNQNVRRFFKAECGEAFKFDRPFMAWLKAADGKTIGDAAREWLRRTARK